MTLKCGNCGKTFDTPFTLNEDEGDEDAEVCPYCESDNFTENPEKSMENKTLIIFSASNEPPPPFLLYDDPDHLNFGAEAQAKLDMLMNWKKVRFVFDESKKQFIPLMAADAHYKITDFKYIINLNTENP